MQSQNFSEEECLNIMKELKYIRDWQIVKEKWEKTVSFRRKLFYENKDKNLIAIINDWPLLKYARAPELVSFTVLHNLVHC